MTKDEKKGHYIIGIIGIGVSVRGSIFTLIKDGIANILFAIMVFGFFIFVMITIVISFHSEQKENTKRIQNLEENLNIQKELTTIKSDISYMRGLIENGKK